MPCADVVQHNESATAPSTSISARVFRRNRIRPAALAAHMGIEQALTNAGFLYRNSMPALQPSRSSAFRTYAAEYLRRAAIVGSIDASVQLVRNAHG
eukprot:scaffold195847_cov33-Tisochrysis_lutea.AAC.2